MPEPKPWNPDSGITLYEDRKLWIDYARELKEQNKHDDETTSIYVDPTPKTHPPLCDRNCNVCPLLIAKNGRMITRILNELHERFGEDVTQIVNGLCPNLTVCFDCRIDDFVHFEGCDLAGDDQHMTTGTDTPE